jgi:ATPase subunit of ABC transporter with duplicated ATPase domains
MAHLLGAESLTLEFPTKKVFDNITIGVNDGDRIGIVGRNGDGKSTLLKLLNRRLEPDEGRITHRNGLTIGLLDQADVIDPGQTIGQAVVGDMPEHEWGRQRQDSRRHRRFAERPRLAAAGWIAFRWSASPSCPRQAFGSRPRHCHAR